ncbi:MAG: DnaD domain protein [Chloroflexota bacterium]
MKKFQGFPSGQVHFTRVPEPLFNDLLPQIDHLGELKVTLYGLWRLDRKDGSYRYLVDRDFLNDPVFMGGMGADPDEAESALQDAIQRAVDHGIFLQAGFIDETGEQTIYFLNTPKGRAAVSAIQRGEWRPPKTDAAPTVLQPTPPNIFRLYEEHIGPLTPMIAEALQDAENTFPAPWIEEGFRIAVEKNVRNWRYIAAILRRWQERGYDVRADRQDTEKDGQQYANWEDD